MKYVHIGALTVLMLGIAYTAAPHTFATAPDATLKRIQELQEKIAALQSQLKETKGELHTLRTGLTEGMTDSDIAKIQELLATDPTIYPEGKKTGYFGPLTKEAIKRLQTRHSLTATGNIDDETRALLEDYLEEGFGNSIPAGLLRAPGIIKKVETRYREGCDQRGLGMGPLCKRLNPENKTESENVEDEESEQNDTTDEATSTDDFDLEIVVETNGSTTVTFTFEDKDYRATSSSSREKEVLVAVAKKLKVKVVRIDETLEQAIKLGLVKAKEEAEQREIDDAKDALEDAQEVIDDAEIAIDDARGDTESAELKFTSAVAKLEDAENAFNEHDYEDALELAEKAKELADDALTLAKAAADED